MFASKNMYYSWVEDGIIHVLYQSVYARFKTIYTKLRLDIVEKPNFVEWIVSREQDIRTHQNGEGYDMTMVMRNPVKSFASRCMLHQSSLECVLVY